MDQKATNWLGVCFFSLYLRIAVGDYYINFSNYFEGL